MPPGKRLRKDMAKIQYKVCKEVIDSLLAQGHNQKMIHDKLTEEGRFTMAYSSFTQILRNAERNIPPAKPVKAAPSPAENRQASPAFPQRQPGIIRAESKTFPDPRTMNPNDSF
jgi:hypothetical protein